MDIKEIKNYLKQNKITYDMLAETSGVPIGTLKSIFSGRTPTPRIDTIAAIEKALELDGREYGIGENVTAQSPLAQQIAQLSDEERNAVSDYIDFIISKRKP